MVSGSVEVRVLTLEDGHDGSSTLYRLKNRWTLLFRLGATLMGKNIRIRTNYPVEGQTFDRTKYNVLDWDTHGKDDTSLTAKIRIQLSGSYHYFFTNDDHRCGQGYFVVEPRFVVGRDCQELPLDSIQCQSVLTKNLGTIDTWESRLLVTKESGYNMIHFTPVQVSL